MEREARGAAFSALATGLSVATAQATEHLPTLRATIQRLAALSSGVIELWSLDTGLVHDAGSWRLLIVEQPPTLTAISPALTPPLDDTIQEAARSRQTVVLDTPTSTISLPLIAWGRVRGVLLVRATAAETDLHTWRREFEQFAPLLALCLCSVSIGQQAAAHPAAARDTLPDRACLLEQLGRELARARRARQPLSLLLLGLDRLDRLPRTLGHDRRERTLTAVAAVLRDTSRNGDLLGRYDDDTFLLLMPEIESQGATFAARRYLDALDRRPITIGGHEPLLLDCSIGIALFPVDGLTLQELIDSASDALLAARRLGGRRAVAA